MLRRKFPSFQFAFSRFPLAVFDVSLDFAEAGYYFCSWSGRRIAEDKFFWNSIIIFIFVD